MNDPVGELAEYYREGIRKDKERAAENGGFSVIDRQDFFDGLDWKDEFVERHGEEVEPLLRIKPLRVVRGYDDGTLTNDPETWYS